MHGYMFGPFGWVWMLLSMVFWLVVIGGVVWLIIWAVRRSSNGSPVNNAVVQAGSGAPSAKDIAQMRYARGEISREEYLQLLEDLAK